MIQSGKAKCISHASVLPLLKLARESQDYNAIYWHIKCINLRMKSQWMLSNFFYQCNSNACEIVFPNQLQEIFWIPIFIHLPYPLFLAHMEYLNKTLY